MAIIRGIQDTLDAEVSRFAQAPLRQPVLVNSIPKGGTHLLRNILRMFVPVAQHHTRDFIQIPNMHEHLDALNPGSPKLSSAHLLFDDQSVANIRHARHILLVRDPYDWVIARARFHVSDAFDQANLQHLKLPGLFSAEVLLNMMIFGIHQKTPPLIDIYTHNAAAWLGTGVYMVRYEDAVTAVRDLGTPASDQFFEWSPPAVETTAVDTEGKPVEVARVEIRRPEPVPVSGKRRPGFLIEAVKLLAGDTEEGKVGVSKLGHYLKRADPSFSPQKYGHSGLINMIKTYDLLSAQVEEGGHWSVKLAGRSTAARRKAAE